MSIRWISFYLAWALLAAAPTALAAQQANSSASTPLWKKLVMPWSATSKTSSGAASAKGQPTRNGQPLWTPSNSSSSWTSNMASGAKKVVNGTADMLTLKPIRDQFSSKPKPTYTPVRREQKKPGLFSSLFKPAAPQGPKTVTEWMSLPRPKF